MAKRIINQGAVIAMKDSVGEIGDRMIVIKEESGSLICVSVSRPDRVYSLLKESVKCSLEDESWFIATPEKYSLI